MIEYFALAAAVSIAGEASALPRLEAARSGDVDEPGAIVAGFRDPPPSCSLQTWWHWLDDCVTREGIARDLKAMAEAGIGTAYVFAPRMSNLPTTAKTMSAEWLDLFAFAIEEAKRNGMELGFHNCPGWSSSGGPWISPEDSMKCLVSSALDVRPADLDPAKPVALPQPPANHGFYRDIRLFAFPVELPPSLVSGEIPKSISMATSDTFDCAFEYAVPFAPSVAVLDIASPSFYLGVEVFAEVDGAWEKRGGRDFRLFREPDVPRTVALTAGAPARRWQVRFRALPNPPWVPRADLPLRSLALGSWPFADGAGSIDAERLLDLGSVPEDGKINAGDLLTALTSPGDASPPPSWRLFRVGYTTTGGGPAPSTIGGLECDKLDRRGLAAHWKAMPARILSLPGAHEVVRSVVIDSYEVGKQTWTETLPDEFRRRTGHDIWSALPAVLGYCVASHEQTAEWKKEFDGVIAELFAENYYDYFAELCHAAGVTAVTEPYGGPFDPVRCGRGADVPTCEFWLGHPLGYSVGKAVEIARAHGKNVIAAEAFTTEAREGRWQATPAQLRRAGDEAWAAGVNQLVYHSYVHQPYIDRAPGSSLGRHGSQLNVNTTWWPQMHVWTDYVRRGQFLLQYGRIARDRHDIVPGKVEALVREGDEGERIWFVRNKGGGSVHETLAMDCATGLPVCEFDAVRGRIFEVERAKEGVIVDLAPGESRFFVFAAGLKGEKRALAGVEIADLSGGWTIATFTGLAAPESPVEADPLFDWSQSADERLRHFSGAADYVREEAFPAGILDLGDVRDIAEVRVDGKRAGTLAYPPHRVEIPAGTRLEVRVVNTWPNRLIGDAIRRSRGEEPFSWSNWTEGWSPDDKLLPAGLLGPVKLFAPCLANQDSPDEEVQTPIDSLPPLGGLIWRLPAKYATLDGDRLVVEIPEDAYPADAVAEADLPAALFDGAEGFSMAVSARGSGLKKPTRNWLGLKFQMHWRESATGREAWPNSANELGDFAEKTLLNEVNFGGAKPDSLTLQLGLQGTSGRVEFDLSTLRGARSRGLFRLVNQDWVVRYPDKPDIANEGAPQGVAIMGAPAAQIKGAATQQMKGAPAAQMVEDNSFAGNAGNLHSAEGGPSFAGNAGTLHSAEGGPSFAGNAGTLYSAEGGPSFEGSMRPLRGCMLPARDTTEDDIATLASWGATLARFQIMRNWSGRDDNQDLAEYAAWIDSRLDNLENVLRWAGEHGMKIVVDLHTVPGGKRAKDGQMNMFEDDTFAEAFPDTWRRIATRFKGHPAIYGYDLVNEPHQKERVRNDYWTLQRRAAEAVRAIDPDTPIIIESDGSDAPAAYAWLSPLRMDNVIYQVHVYAPMLFTHQGVHGIAVGPKWPDPANKWDKDFLRETLRPVREFALRHNARIYVGEFSAIAWAEGAENYLRDCIELFGEYGWDWTYHAFREWKGWSVEHEGPDGDHMVPSPDTSRKRVLLEGMRGR